MSDTSTQNSSGYGKGYGKRPMWQWILIYVVIGAIVYGLIYYFVLAKRGGYSQNNPYQYQPTAAQQGSEQLTSASQVTPPTTSGKTVSVEGNEFAFTPSALTLKKGEAVTLTFKNTGAYPHNFTISDLGVQTKTVQPGESDTITFTPDKAGTFKSICSVDSHADKGMTGTVNVQ